MLSLCLKVARRVHSEERASREGEGGKKRAVRYRVALAEEDVYLHPQSGLHSRSPQFLVYTQLVRSAKRPYMAGDCQAVRATHRRNARAQRPQLKAPGDSGTVIGSTESKCCFPCTNQC